MATVPTPKTFSVNEVLTASTMNTEIRDAQKFLLDPPRVFAQNVTAISVPNAAYAAVALITEQYDTDGMHDTVTNNSRFTCITPGLYDLKAMIYWTSNSTGMRGAQIRLNGATALSYDFRPSQATLIQQTCVDWYLNAGDYVELLAYQNSGAALNTQNVFMSARWVAQ